MRPLDGQVDSEPSWDGFVGEFPGCELENGEWEYEEDMFVATSIEVRKGVTGQGIGSYCTVQRYNRGILGSLPGTPTLGCDPTNLPPGQVPRNFGHTVEQLTPDEVQACSCALQEYVRTLNDVNNITPINNGIPMSTEPYICPTCPPGPESIVTITKVSEPPGRKGFEFESDGFSSLVGCGFTGDNGNFILDDGDSIRCGVPVGDYSISENVPNGYELFIVCFGDNDNLIIDNIKGEITFSVPEIDPSPDVDCIFTNIRKGDGGNGGGCTLAPAGASNSIPLYLFIPVLILIRRIVKRYRS